MSKDIAILDLLKSRGHRMTKARKAIVKIIAAGKVPLTAADINARLRKVDIDVNKTTIYREIDFLKGQRIIRELQFGDRKKRYEKWPDNHHHHLVCVSCDSVECVEIKKCLEDEEQKFLKEKNFRTIDHSLEFHGVCAKCQ